MCAQFIRCCCCTTLYDSRLVRNGRCIRCREDMAACYNMLGDIASMACIAVLFFLMLVFGTALMPEQDSMYGEAVFASAQQ